MATMVHRTCEFQEALTAYDCQIWLRDADKDDAKADEYFRIAFLKADWAISLAKDLGLNPNMVCKKCVTFMHEYANKRHQMGLLWNG